MLVERSIVAQGYLELLCSDPRTDRHIHRVEVLNDLNHLALKTATIITVTIVQKYNVRYTCIYMYNTQSY